MALFEADTTSAGRTRYAGGRLDHIEEALAELDLLEPTAKVASYTLALVDARTCVEVSNASGVTVTIPPFVDVEFPVGTVIELWQAGAGQITVAAGAGVTLRSTPTAKARAQYSTLRLRKRDTNVWVLSGDTAAS